MLARRCSCSSSSPSPSSPSCARWPPPLPRPLGLGLGLGLCLCPLCSGCGWGCGLPGSGGTRRVTSLPEVAPTPRMHLPLSLPLPCCYPQIRIRPLRVSYATSRNVFFTRYRTAPTTSLQVTDSSYNITDTGY
jgi:hypothetical protein